MKLLTQFFLLLIICGFTIHAQAEGNEGRGTEDAVILGKFLKQRLDKEGVEYFELRKRFLKDQLSTGEAKNWAVEFFRQVPGPSLLAPAKADEFDVRVFYSHLQSLGAAQALESSTIKLSDKCIDVNGEPRTATTNPAPGSEICVNIERVALLELALSEGEANINPIVTKEDGVSVIKRTKDYAVPTSTLFGILMHETARQFNLDDDHEFLYAMRKEPDRHYVMLHPASNLMSLGRTYVSYRDETNFADVLHIGMNYKLGQTFTVQLRLSTSANPNCLSLQELQVFAPGKWSWFERNILQLDMFLYEFQDMKINPSKSVASFTYDPVDVHAPLNLIHDITLYFGQKFINANCHNSTLLEILDASGVVIYSKPAGAPFNPLESRPVTKSGFRKVLEIWPVQ